MECEIGCNELSEVMRIAVSACLHLNANTWMWISDEEELTDNTNRYPLNKPLPYPIADIDHNDSYM